MSGVDLTYEEPIEISDGEQRQEVIDLTHTRIPLRQSKLVILVTLPG
jgi:hypothetical protein